MRERPGSRFSHLCLRLLLVVVTLLPAVAEARRALVVFGSAVRPDGSFSASLQRRLDKALDLARRDPRSLVVVSGGTAAGPAEGPAMARWLRAQGVAGRRIVVEPCARNTRENADRVVPLLQAAGVDRVTLVSERYHLRRARFHLRAALSDAGLPVQLECSAAPDGLRGAARATTWLRESAKILRDAGYRLRDRLRAPHR